MWPCEIRHLHTHTRSMSMRVWSVMIPTSHRCCDDMWISLNISGGYCGCSTSNSNLTVAEFFQQTSVIIEPASPWFMDTQSNRKCVSKGWLNPKAKVKAHQPDVWMWEDAADRAGICFQPSHQWWVEVIYEPGVLMKGPCRRLTTACSLPVSNFPNPINTLGSGSSVTSLEYWVKFGIHNYA